MRYMAKAAFATAMLALVFGPDMAQAGMIGPDSTAAIVGLGIMRRRRAA